MSESRVHQPQIKTTENRWYCSTRATGMYMCTIRTYTYGICMQRIYIVYPVYNYISAHRSMPTVLRMSVVHVLRKDPSSVSSVEPCIMKIVRTLRQHMHYVYTYKQTSHPASMHGHACIYTSCLNCDFLFLTFSCRRP